VAAKERKVLNSSQRNRERLLENVDDEGKTKSRARKLEGDKR